jgi:hypothetical protein
MERTLGNTLVVTEFQGVNQLLDEVKLDPSLVAWMFGMMTEETASLRRVSGKVPATTGTVAAMLSIRQLTFDGARKLVVHAGTGIFAVTETLTVLRSSSSGIFPVNPFIPLEGGPLSEVWP